MWLLYTGSEPSTIEKWKQPYPAFGGCDHLTVLSSVGLALVSLARSWYMKYKKNEGVIPAV